MSEPQVARERQAGSAPRGQAWLGLLACLVLVLLSMQARVWRALSDPNFDAVQAEGMLKSDPGLLHYITERIIDAEGSAPRDFRADPRVQHPAQTDLAAEFTVGQEFLVAWAYRISGTSEPLHVFATRLMALVAALAALGVYGVVHWRTRRVGLALGAVGLFCLLPANYRTIGFILIREDLALPLFLGHLALLACAESRRSARAYLGSGLLLGLALATWHAMGFFLVLELLVLHAWFLRKGPSPLESRGAWAVLIGPILAATLVPALQRAGLLLGLPMALAVGLFGLAWLRGRYRAKHPGQAMGRLSSVLWATGLVALVLLLGALLSPERGGYAHVYDVLVAKLMHLGSRPLDPNTIPFDARLLWQGPFETLSIPGLQAFLGWALLLVPAALWLALRARPRLSGFEAFLLAFALVALPSAWLISRTVILLGALLPMLVLLFHGRAHGKRWGLALGALLLVQAVGFARYLDGLRLSWYQPAERQAELAALVRWVDANLDSSEPIVGDFMNSTALLAHTGNPIVLQPKYETEHSRERAQVFLETFFQGTPRELSELVRGRFQSELLLVDRYTLGALSPWVAGFPAGPLPGSVGERLLSQDAAQLGSLPGFELIYRSPDTLRTPGGEPSDYFRLYRLR